MASKDTVIQTRVSRDLYQSVSTRASSCGMTISEYIRTLLMLPIFLDVRPGRHRDEKLYWAIRMCAEHPPEDHFRKLDSLVANPFPFGTGEDAAVEAVQEDFHFATKEEARQMLARLISLTDHVNPDWVLPPDEGKETRPFVEVLGAYIATNHEDAMPLAVIDRRTGAVFASVAKPPLLLISDLPLASLTASINRASATIGDLERALLKLADSIGRRSRSLKKEEFDYFQSVLEYIAEKADLIADGVQDTGNAARFMINLETLKTVDLSE